MQVYAVQVQVVDQTVLLVKEVILVVLVYVIEMVMVEMILVVLVYPVEVVVGEMVVDMNLVVVGQMVLLVKDIGLVVLW